MDDIERMQERDPNGSGTAASYQPVIGGDIEMSPVVAEENKDNTVVSTNDIVYDDEGVYKSFSPENAPVILSWKNLSVTTKPRGKIPAKTIINNVDGTITGGLWGIMGASGSGKTTLLSVLSLRMDTNRMNRSGQVTMNGKKYTSNLLKSMSGYVMQDDLIHAMLTVSETLYYASALRMSSTFTAAERQQRCNEVLELMGIGYCKDVIVGDSRNKGISGGERKRVCVAMELLNKPKLLFLDEPTSGLDSTTALDLMNTLKQLADSGECTVVCTIHQPQTKIYNLLDNLLLMKKGEIVYMGSCAKADTFFAKQGYPCPEKTNPADHLIDLISQGTNADKAESKIARLSVPVDLDCGLDKDQFTMRALHNWLFQFGILFHRNSIEKIRRWDVILMNVVITCIVGTFIGMGAWHQIGTTQAAVAKINPIMFFCVIHQGVVSSLQGTYAFPLERALMLRERASGAYYVSAYFLAKTTVDMLVQLIMPAIFTCFVYPMCGLDPLPIKFFRFMALNMLLSVSATSLSNMCSCIFVSIEMSTVVLACCMEITRLYSSFFVSPALLEQYPKWKFFRAVSYMSWGYIGLVLNEYKAAGYHCTTQELLTNAATKTKYCKINYGQQQINIFHYDIFSLDFCFGMMVVYIVFCRLVSYLALRFIKV
eukprot:gene5179-7206_t